LCILAYRLCNLHNGRGSKYRAKLRMTRSHPSKLPNEFSVDCMCIWTLGQHCVTLRELHLANTMKSCRKYQTSARFLFPKELLYVSCSLKNYCTEWIFAIRNMCKWLYYGVTLPGWTCKQDKAGQTQTICDLDDLTWFQQWWCNFLWGM